MEFVIILCVIAIAISCISIDGKLRKTSQQNEQIIELLKQIKEK